MNLRVGPFQRLAVFALMGVMGGCELMKHVTIQTDDRNPNSFAEAHDLGPRAGQNRMELEFRLWPHDGAK